MRSAALSLVVLAVAVGSGSWLVGAAQAAVPPLTWKVDPAPFRLTVLQGSRVVLREHTGLPGPGTRLAYRITQGGGTGALTDLIGTATTPEGAVYTVGTTESDRVATVTVSRTSLGLRVDVGLGTAATTVRTVYESFDAGASEHFLGGGEQRDTVDLRGHIVSTKVWAGCGNSKPSPFFLSTAGYGIRFATTAVGRMAFGPVSGPGCDGSTNPCEIAPAVSVVQACFKTATLSYEIYPGTPEQAIRSYAARSGRPAPPDPAQFAVTKWRDVVNGDADLTDDADRFAAAGIPLGWLIIDNPWEQLPCVGSMNFDRRRFPDPSRTISALHARDIRVMMWVSPSVQAECSGLYPANRVYGSGHLRAIDLTDPLVAASFEQRLVTLFAAGIDGLKVDRGDEVDFEGVPLAGGNGSDIHDAYPVLVAQSINRAAQAARARNVPTLFRSGYMGSQSLATGSWSGDLPGTWGGLEAAVRSAQTAGLTGFSTWGSDIGGYDSTSLTSDVFVRWSQLGAISPVFEVGGVGANAKPWTLGAGAMSGLKKAAALHYELFPTLYQLARRASATGVPVLRPLALQYPDDGQAWRADHELLVGSSLLAAPVTSPGTQAQVYLPAGEWVDLGTGAKLRGPLSLTRSTPIDELPLYLRSGTAIPYNLRAPDVWQAPWGLNDLFRQGRGGWVVAPGSGGVAGDSADYGSVRGSATARGLRLVLTRAPGETEVVVLGARLPQKVTIAGRPFARTSSAAALRPLGQGWLMRRGRLGGILLKLAPSGGRAVVTLSY